MKFVTLIGSHKFYKDFLDIKSELEENGDTHVLTPEIFNIADPAELSEQEHQYLDELHRSKMRMAEYVLVVNKNGYIGKDTQEEIEWCRANNITLKFLEKPIVELPKITFGIYNEEARAIATNDLVEVTDPISESMGLFRTRIDSTLTQFAKWFLKRQLQAMGKTMLLNHRVEEADIRVHVEIGE